MSDSMPNKEWIAEDVPPYILLEKYLNSNPHPEYEIFQILSVTSGQFGYHSYKVIWKRITGGTPEMKDSSHVTHS